MANFSDESWDVGKARRGKSAAEYCALCLINVNEGPSEDWIKDNCKLPVRYTAGGPYVRPALRAAARRIFQVRGVPAEKKRAAVRKLVSLMKAAGIEVGSAALLRLAGQRAR